MITFSLVVLSLFLGAFGRRAAGGALNQWFRPNGPRVMGDTPARLIFGVTVALPAFLCGAIWWQALLLIPAVWVGTTTGNFGSIALGRSGNPWWRDVAGLTLHGVLSALPPALLAIVFGYPWGFMLLSGFLIAPLYELGWIISGKSGNVKLPVGLKGGAELGEAFWGAACAICAALTFLV